MSTFLGRLFGAVGDDTVWDSRAPVRDELFSAERLETHTRRLEGRRHRPSVPDEKALPMPASRISVDTAATEPPVLFEVRGLTRSYRTAAGDVHALRGVDIDIRQGEVIVLLGPSGSGKSTLLNILGGLDRASAGSIVYQGRDLAEASDAELTEYRRRSIGFIFQFFNLTPSLTARENVELITEIATRPMGAEEALEMVGLSDRLDHFPAQLSGGQQQRLAVARAIAKRPDILFCDEPTGSLDSESGVQVLRAILTVSAEVGATVLIVTHNAGVADIADRVIRFRDGRIVEVTRNPSRRAPESLSW